MDQELELLVSVPPSSPRNTHSEAMDRRGKGRESQSDMWKLDTPLASGALDGKGPLLDPTGKVNYSRLLLHTVLLLLTQPLRPFTILPSDATSRARLQAQVFGAGHRLPTMSIDEYLQIERERGNIITGGGCADCVKYFLSVLTISATALLRKLPQHPPNNLLSRQRWTVQGMEKKSSRHNGKRMKTGQYLPTRILRGRVIQ